MLEDGCCSGEVDASLSALLPSDECRLDDLVCDYDGLDMVLARLVIATALDVPLYWLFAEGWQQFIADGEPQPGGGSPGGVPGG